MRRELWFDRGLVHQGLALVSKCMCTKCLLVRLVVGRLFVFDHDPSVECLPILHLIPCLDPSFMIFFSMLLTVLIFTRWPSFTMQKWRSSSGCEPSVAAPRLHLRCTCCYGGHGRLHRHTLLWVCVKDNIWKLRVGGTDANLALSKPSEVYMRRQPFATRWKALATRHEHEPNPQRLLQGTAHE